jgi:hypothetical protein
MPGRPILSVSAPLRCADYRTEATKQEATGTQPAERTERALFWLTYDSSLPDGGHNDPERLYKAIRYLEEHPEQQVHQFQLRIFEHGPPPCAVPTNSTRNPRRIGRRKVLPPRCYSRQRVSSTAGVALRWFASLVIRIELGADPTLDTKRDTNLSESKYGPHRIAGQQMIVKIGRKWSVVNRPTCAIRGEV